MFEFIKKLFSKPVDAQEISSRTINGSVFPKVDDPRWKSDPFLGSEFIVISNFYGVEIITIQFSPETEDLFCIYIKEKEFAGYNNQDAKTYASKVLAYVKKRDLEQAQKDLLKIQKKQKKALKRLSK